MKRTLAILLVLALTLGLCACGNTPAADDGAKENKEDKVITIAASPTPHAEILAVAKEVLAKDGWDLQILEFEDYVQPNMVVDSGEVFANYFQHVPYLDDFNANNGTKIVSVADVHVEPMAIYPGKSNDLAKIADGAQIAVPNDTTNEARALLLLENNGVIKLKADAGILATKNDIVENPYNVEIIEAEAAQLPNVLQDVDFAVINCNYAIEAGLNPVTDSVAVEGSFSAYNNIVCVKEGNEKDPKTLALIEAVHSPEVKKFITDKYNGSVICVF